MNDQAARFTSLTAFLRPIPVLMTTLETESECFRQSAPPLAGVSPMASTQQKRRTPSFTRTDLLHDPHRQYTGHRLLRALSIGTGLGDVVAIGNTRPSIISTRATSTCLPASSTTGAHSLQIFNESLYNDLIHECRRPGGCKDKYVACRDALRERDPEVYFPPSPVI